MTPNEAAKKISDQILIGPGELSTLPIIQQAIATATAEMQDKLTALQAERDRLRGLLLRFLQWDALNPMPQQIPPPFGDIVSWAAEFAAALATKTEGT